jgi:hypothetical protein
MILLPTDARHGAPTTGGDTRLALLGGNRYADCGYIEHVSTSWMVSEHHSHLTTMLAHV